MDFCENTNLQATSTEVFLFETLEITAINRYDSDLTFCNNFTEQCLQKMGLTNKDSMSKIERLLTQARDGENEDSQLYFNIPGHDMPPAFDVTYAFIILENNR